ncbi:MAG: right-handed parallel beta-helix repeat-containing protein [Candidatus Sumerlaeota bacterium]|nr:right-handed parallel beta-helix repeat-containing protein [Candidatus Sumerlaeota bacterium]
MRAIPAPLTHIAITNNTFNHPGEAAIALSNVTSGVISGNRINNPIQYTALAKPGKPSRRQAIYLSRCAKINLSGNTISDPGYYSTPDAITSSKVVGTDEKCSDIMLNGKGMDSKRTP